MWLAALAFVVAPATADAGTVPPGFQDSVVLSGFTNPTAVRFAADGRVFVAEKSGIIKVFDDLNDPTPTTFANLNVNVYNFWDRGLLGMALAPNFPADPYVYVLYTYDAAIGGVAPRWGTPGVLSDPCPTPPGPTTDGCVVSGRLSRLQANGNVMTGSEQVLIEDWCQQFPSHSIGSIEFGSDGALYVSGGDGASFNFADWGQTGQPRNPCADPPGSAGSNLSPPTAEGGALRSQDLRTPADPVSLDGTIARVDPVTGAGRPDNPLWSSSDPNARRIIAQGSRNPFRFTIRPGTSEVWSGDVGWNTWEEINRLGSPIDPVIDNFGWPCYEGPDREGSYDAANLNICEGLYSAGPSAWVAPYLTYNHGARVVTGESCPTGSSSISGLAFYNGGNYPDHTGALFFADYSRNCIWVMKAGTNGLPDTGRITTFDAGAAGPVDIEIGPGGDLFYAGFDEGTIRRIRYFAGNQPPNAVATANPQSGPIPLTVSFDGRGSSDPENGALTYSWDLDGNGTFGDSTSPTPQFTYTQVRTVTVQLRVTDPQGASATDAIVVNAGNNTPPVPVISTPSATTTWRVGDLISFSGSATDTQDGTIPASRLTWELVMNHCPSNCHTHPIQTFAGVASGSFNTPDHEYPSHLELKLTATDTAGASTTTSVRLNPRTVDLTFLSNPAGVELAVNGASAIAPFTRTVIQGSNNTVSAVSPQTVAGNTYTFTAWSDGGAQTHSIVAGTTPATFTASYDVSVPGPVAAYGFEEPSGSTVTDSSGTGNNGTLTAAARTTAGKFGSALTFNGSSSWVTVPDAPSLDLTSSMTLEAWVKPTTLAGTWRTVLMKEQTGDIVYDLYANRTGTAQVPLAEVYAAGAPRQAQGTSTLPLNVWTHLAATYDNNSVRLYVNGTQVANTPAAGDMPNSSGPLRIGGNGIWNEWFDGQIDEVRVYGRVLTQAEIQADMNKAVVNPDSGPPTAPGGLNATGGVGSVSLSWNASTDDVGVVRYNVHRSTTQGFTPSAANRVGQPTTTSFTDPGLAAGTYYYRVTAEDAAGNISAASGEASAIVTGDTQAPTAPSGLSASGSLSSVALAWSGSTDNVGVVRYNVHRSTTQGFTPSAANRVGQPTGTSFTDSPLAAGTYYYRVTAEDAAGNVSAASNEATAVVTGDTTPPTAPATLTATPGSLSAQLSWSAAGDNVGVVRYNLHRSTTNGFTPSAANRIAQPTGTSYADGGLAAGTYYYRVTAEDAAGNVGPASPQATAVVTSAPAGLVAAYSFDEGSGTTLGDSSGRGNNGSIANATWVTTGRYGKALQFNGSNALVTVPDSSSLDLTTGMTLEAWVNPSQLGGPWRTVIMKEQTGNLVYDLYAHGGTGTKTPMGEIFAGGGIRETRAPSTLALNTWTHLALSYDGTTLRLYVGGTQVATQAFTGTILASNGPLRIGGNGIWNEWFQGMIDEVRIYNRALTATEIQADLATSVGNQDTTAPTAPSGLSANGSVSSVALSWTGSTDNVGVLRYNVHRSTTQGFTPSAANRIAQPTGTSFTDSPLSPGTYYYRVTAEDAAGNISAASAEATAVVTGDTQAPTAPSGLSGIGSLSSVALSWSGSTDNVGVVRYNVHRGTTSGFTPSAANRVGQPTGTSFTDTGLAAGTYYYRVTAEDAAGNISTASNEAPATVTGDTTPPTPPSGLSANGSVSSVALSWTGSSDNVGVLRYNVHRSTTDGFTPSAANRVGQPSATSFTDSPLTPGTYYYRVTAEDAAGNVSTASAQASAVVTGDVTAPSPPAGLTATPGPNSAVLGWSASNDNVGVVRYNLHRSTTNGFTPSAANRIAQPTGTSYTDSPLAPGTYYYRVTAEDAAGNVSGASAQATATVSAQLPGLVAAYAFDEGGGTTAGDSSGNNNNGTLANGTWSASGKFGSAIQFNGSNTWVTVPDSASLDLTSGMTLEAWVNPSVLNSWRTVAFKEQAGNLVYGLYANTSALRPNAQVFVAGSDRSVNGTTQIQPNVWTHLAATYDGANLRLFVNGTQAAAIAQTGAISTSTGVLRIGGNNVWSEWFQGLIDEVRVYNRALSATEIQSDMAASISTPDTTAPTAPTGLGATGSIGRVTLNWTAATDDVGVVRYNVHRGTSPGFTPSAANRIAQPTGTTYQDNGLAAGTYYYRVTAQDAAGNVGPASNEATGTATADTTAPTVSVTSPASGATVSGTTTVSATATDNVAVAGVQFKLDGANLGTEVTSAPYTLAWDTRTASVGPHTLTAVARDAAGNQTTSASVPITVEATVTPPAGLVAGYGFDEGSGTSVGDASLNGNTGTASNTSWVPGRFGTALSFNGSTSWVTVPDSASLDLTSAVTLEAWVYPTVLGTSWRTVLFKEQPGDLTYGLYANTTAGRPNAQVYAAGDARQVNGPSTLPVNTWTHLAMTYDGANLRLFVNGTQAAAVAQGGGIATSSGVLRIGGNNIWPEWFQGRIDEVRVYNRALTASEIVADSGVAVARDTTSPTVTNVTPAAGATDVAVSSAVTANFSEAMDPSTITGTTFELRNSGGTLVPATVTYDALSAKATLTPSTALLFGETYTARLIGGPSGTRVKDMSGNPLASTFSWPFTIEATAPPILLVTGSSNPFASYTAEILRAEGLNEFATVDASLLSTSFLAFFDVAVVGNVPLGAPAVTALTTWVNGGGNLIALRPDKQLAGLLGLTDAGTTLTNGYVLVNTASGPGAGIVGETIQFHGTADRYTLNGATSVATLYSSASTATTNPAVTLRSVGSSGGQAAAFTYDLARSVVYTRQGNPAWAGQDRDGVFPIRTNDLFFGAMAGDVQPDWIDLNKMHIPQADEQQRLLANLVTSMARDRKPIPRFWYLPRGEKAAVVMTGDDHAQGGTAGRFDQYKALSPAGCSVANWGCIRSTSYVYPNSPLTNAQAQGYVADGFEVALHLNTNGGPCGNFTPAELETYYTVQLSQFQSKYVNVPAPVTERTHCVAWSDWASQPKTKRAHGIRLDTNYYNYPGSWIGSRPGFMTGSGMVMRFADVDGTTIDEYQAATQMTDESGQTYPANVNTLLDNAVGPQGYWGVFTANMHTDLVSSPGSDAIVSSALARDVPIVSAKQILDWTEGRNASSFREFSWAGNTLGFRIVVGAGANGLEAMLPLQGPSGTLTSLQRGGTPVATTTRTVKGVDYAVFNAVGGTYTAVYG